MTNAVVFVWLSGIYWTHQNPNPTVTHVSQRVNYFLCEVVVIIRGKYLPRVESTLWGGILGSGLKTAKNHVGTVHLQ